MHARWLEKANMLMEKERYMDARFPELRSLEESLSQKLSTLEGISKEILFGIQSSDHASR